MDFWIRYPLSGMSDMYVPRRQWLVAMSRGEVGRTFNTVDDRDPGHWCDAIDLTQISLPLTARHLGFLRFASRLSLSLPLTTHHLPQPRHFDIMAKGKSSASSATRKKHARKAANAAGELDEPQLSKEKKQKNEIAVTKSLEQWYVGDVREAVRYWNSLNNTQRGREWQRVQGRPPPGAQRYAVFEGEDMVRSDLFVRGRDRADIPISAPSVASSRTPSIGFGAPGPACPRAGDASTRRKSAWASGARLSHTG